MVDWKKEIKLSDLVRRPNESRERKPEPRRTPEPRGKGVAKGEETAFWKKEISFGRKPTEAKQRDRRRIEEARPEPTKAAKPPFWKKQVTVGRKPTEAKQRDRRRQEETKHEPSKAAKPPFWKKQLTVGRKQTDPKADERRRIAEPTPELKEPAATPFWKKELSLGRRPQEERRLPAAAPPQPAAAPSPPTPVVPSEPAAEKQPSTPPAEAETWPTVPLPDDLLEAPEPPAASKSGSEEPEPAPPSVPPAQRRRLPGLSVPHPKLPGRPVRRPGDHGRRSPGQEQRRSSDRMQSVRSLFQRKRRRAQDDASPNPSAKGKAGARQTQGKFGRPTLGRHRKTQLVGLKIGASQLAAAQIVNNGVAELVQVAREPLEPGIVVGGEPRDFDALVGALRDFFKKHRLPRRGVRLGISNNRIGVRSFEISGIDDPGQLANAVKFRAQEVLPIPLDQAVMDYQVLEERVDSEGVTRRRILLVVAYRELIERYVAACRQAGIKLVGIDLEAFALLRAVANPSQLPPARVDAALVVVSIGHEQSTFALSDGQSCDFTRVFDWGGASLNIAISRALDITPSQAEPIKRSLTLARSDQPVADPDERTEKAREVVLQQLHAFARDLVSSLHFYQNQPGSLSIGEIVLTGGTAHLPGLPEELERLIGVPVRLGNPLVRVKTGKQLPAPTELGSLSVAIGLGMEA